MLVGKYSIDARRTDLYPFVSLSRLRIRVAFWKIVTPPKTTVTCSRKICTALAVKIHHSTTPGKTLSVDAPLFFLLTIPPANVGHIQAKPSDAPAKNGYFLLKWPRKIRGHVSFRGCTLNLETSFGNPCAIVTTWMFHCLGEG